MKVKCPKCGYTWDTRSRLIYVVCPNCRKTFRKEAHVVEEGGRS